MGGLRDFLGGHQVISFFAFTFVFSWYFWGAAVSIPESRELYVVLGGFGPSVVGLALVYLFKGWEGIRGMLSKMVAWRVNPLFLVFALFGAVLFVVPAMFAGGYLGGAGGVDPSQWTLIIVNFGYALVFGMLGEELGWRGFALPRIQRDAVALVSGLVIGLVWGLWYIPLWFVPGNIHQSLSFPLFLAQMVGLSVLITWLYNNTGGSLLIVGLFHAASNTTLGLLPTLPLTVGTLPTLISAGLIWVLVAVITFAYGPTYLSKEKKYTLFGEFSWEYED